MANALDFNKSLMIFGIFLKVQLLPRGTRLWANLNFHWKVSNLDVQEDRLEAHSENKQKRRKKRAEVHVGLFIIVGFISSFLASLMLLNFTDFFSCYGIDWHLVPSPSLYVFHTLRNWAMLPPPQYPPPSSPTIPIAVCAHTIFLRARGSSLNKTNQSSTK